MANNAFLSGLTDANVASGANVSAKKVQGWHHQTYSQTGTVVAGKSYVFVGGATCTIRTFQAAVTETIATGGDRTVTVDLQKSTGGGAFASVLSAAIALTSGSTLLVPSAATVSVTSLSANDILVIVVTVAGAAGAQALGLVADVVLNEAAF